MTAQVNWTINSMDRDISSGGVKDVEWSCIGRDSVDTTASVTNSSNTVFTPDASKAGFKAYDALAESDVLGWVQAKEDKAAIEKIVKDKIVAQVAANKLTASGVPW